MIAIINKEETFMYSWLNCRQDIHINSVSICSEYYITIGGIIIETELTKEEATKIFNYLLEVIKFELNRYNPFCKDSTFVKIYIKDILDDKIAKPCDLEGWDLMSQ